MSLAYSRQLRMVGEGLGQPFEIEIGRINKLVKRDGKQMRAIAAPYLPKHLGEPFHPGGNSICFSIQLAHLMGARAIYLLGFTLQNGSRYFCGDRNPVLKRPAIYDSERACHWLKWYEAAYPGRARLLPGWSGPVYDVLQVVSDAELTRKLRESGDREGGARRDAEEQHVPPHDSGDVRRDRSVYADGE